MNCMNSEKRKVLYTRLIKCAITGYGHTLKITHMMTGRNFILFPFPKSLIIIITAEVCVVVMVMLGLRTESLKRSYWYSLYRIFLVLNYGFVTIQNNGLEIIHSFIPRYHHCIIGWYVSSSIYFLHQ